MTTEESRARHTEYMREWRSRPGSRERIKGYDAAYAATERGREVRLRARAGWKTRNPEIVRIQRAAEMRVLRALANGTLKKAPCEVCGDSAVQAHHPNGYVGDAALDVRWLCVPDHRKAHDR